MRQTITKLESHWFQTKSNVININIARKAYNSIDKYKNEKSKHVKKIKRSLRPMENKFRALVKCLNLL